MLKKYLSWLISGLLLFTLAPRQAASAAQGDKQTGSVEQIKSQVAKIGVGEKAKATVILKDGTKTKGYVAQTGEDSFVMRDRKTDAPTSIRYADVAKVERNRGHSTAKHLGIGIGIGVGAFVAILAIVFASLND